MEDNALIDTAVRQSLERAATRDPWSAERDQSDQPHYGVPNALLHLRSTHTRMKVLM